MRVYAWPIAQAAVAAGAAWSLAHTVLGHPQPFFAPIAAVVALAVSTGGRGTQAAQMLLGVAVGVVVGELLVRVLGTGAPEVALAAGAAMLAVAAFSTQPLPLIQAGSSAVLVIALQSPETGTERIVDALIGGGIALLVSQLLLPPSPVSLLKGASREALTAISENLRASAKALSEDDATLAETALQRLREKSQGPIAGLAGVRDTSGKVARRTLRGRLEAERYVRLDARIGELDLLSGSVLFLTRATCRLLEERVSVPGWLVPAIRKLARAVEALAEDPESPDSGRRAGDALAGAIREVDRDEEPGAVPDSRVALVVEGIRLTASDIAKLTAPEEIEPTGHR